MLTAALVAAFFLAPPAHAQNQSEQQCALDVMATEIVQEAGIRGFEHWFLLGDDAQTFVDNYNNYPPVTTVRAARAFFIWIPRSLRLTFFLFEGECVVANGGISLIYYDDNYPRPMGLKV